MPRRDSPYARNYERVRRAVIAQRLSCHLKLVCDGATATSADHDPPLALHHHQPGSGCCVLRPACLPCQKTQGKEVARILRLGLNRKLPEPSRQW